MIKGLIFDFDGLILDTEYPLFRAWQEIYAQNGCNLPFMEWAAGLGTSADAFDPVACLEKMIHKPVDVENLVRMHARRASILIDAEEPLPGVREYLQAGKKMGLKLAVASSSSRKWVLDHLNRLGLDHFFDLIRGSEDVEWVKPDPALFRSALLGLGITPEEAVVFEDSPNGITAAKAAGVYCVVVPNRISRYLAIQHADQVIQSMLSISLPDLIAGIEKVRFQQPSTLR